MAAFFTSIYWVLQNCSYPSSLFSECNYLKPLALCKGYNCFIIDKALNKFKKTKHSVCHSDPYSILFFCLFILPFLSKSLKHFPILVPKFPSNLLNFLVCECHKDLVPTEY